MNIQLILPAHELVILNKFHNDWVKIADFSIMARNISEQVRKLMNQSLLMSPMGKKFKYEIYYTHEDKVEI